MTNYISSLKSFPILKLRKSKFIVKLRQTKKKASLHSKMCSLMSRKKEDKLLNVYG